MDGSTRKNLIEITVALNLCQTGEPSLVANLSGKRIYYAAKGWGKLWTWFYTLAGYFQKPQLSNEKLSRALEKTHACYLQCEQEALKSRERYIQAIGSNYVQEESLALYRRVITEWNTISYELKTASKKAHACVLKHYFSDLERKIWKDVQRLINLEGATKSRLPPSLLQMTQREWAHNNTCKIFWQRICQRKPKIGCRLVLQALRAYLRLRKLEATPERLYKFALNLHSHDQTDSPFFLPDPKVLKWRASLRQNSKIFCNGTQHILETEQTLYNFRLFTLRNNPEQMMFIGPNSCMIPFYNLTGSSPVLPRPPFKDIDKGCKIALIDPILFSLTTPYEFAQEPEQLTDEARQLIDGTGRWICNCIKKMAMPSPLKLSLISIDKNFNLCSFVHASVIAFDYLKMEEFLFSFAGKSLFAYRELMEKSTMNRQNAYRALRWAIHFHFKMEPLYQEHNDYLNGHLEVKIRAREIISFIEKAIDKVMRSFQDEKEVLNAAFRILEQYMLFSCLNVPDFTRLIREDMPLSHDVLSPSAADTNTNPSPR